MVHIFLAYNSTSKIPSKRYPLITRFVFSIFLFWFLPLFLLLIFLILLFLHLSNTLGLTSSLCLAVERFNLWYSSIFGTRRAIRVLEGMRLPITHRFIFCSIDGEVHIFLAYTPHSNPSRPHGLLNPMAHAISGLLQTPSGSVCSQVCNLFPILILVFHSFISFWSKVFFFG